MIFDSTMIPYAVALCFVLLVIWIIRLEYRIHKMLIGKNAKSLEDSIISAGQNLEKLNTFQKDSIEYFKSVEARLNQSIRAVETVRFNPFKGTGEGGNQSFSTAFVNKNGSGVVISSLYSRDRVSIFGKPLEKFESTFELTGEEKEVVTEAKKNVQ